MRCAGRWCIETPEQLKSAHSDDFRADDCIGRLAEAMKLRTMGNPKRKQGNGNPKREQGKMETRSVSEKKQECGLRLADASGYQIPAKTMLAQLQKMRIGSEPRQLRWQGVDWESKTITYRPVKPEHHEGHAERPAKNGAKSAAEWSQNDPQRPESCFG